MASRKIFNYESVILNDITLEIEGYHPDKFGKTSNKFIWARCRFCGKGHRIRKGFFSKAGSACHKECRMKEQSIAGSPFNNPATREKAKQTNKERYGTEHACQNKEIANRISKSRSTQKCKDKIAKTNLKKYGVENPFQSEEIKEKIKETNREKYGHDHAMQSDKIKQKTKQTNQDRFGFDNPMKSPEVRNKAIQTNLSKYGHVNPMQNIEIQNKALKQFHQTVNENKNGRYDQINILRSDYFWEQLGSGETLKNICNEFGLDYQSTTAKLVDDEFKEKYYSTYTFPTQQKQREVYDFVIKNGFSAEYNTRSIISNAELDIYIPSFNFAIEFNGNYWHSEACLGERARTYHRIKTDACRSKGIRLFHLFEHQWENRRPQILNFLKSILGIIDQKVHGRKCTITNEPCKQFLNDNHIQGYGQGTIRYFNLVHDGDIVASMTASRHHRQGQDSRCIVLNRLCFKDGVLVRGGASKLFKAFISWAAEEGYTSVVSWSDSCWTEGAIYGVLGFELVEEYGPDYFYWDLAGHKYVSKQTQQKKKTGCPEGMTEREWCIERGLSRIYDAGKKKWCYRLKN